LADELAKPWACVFLARSGGHALARFTSRLEAKRFAERHARAFVPETPILWQDRADSSALETAIGEYLVTFNDAPGSVGGFARPASRKVGVGLGRHRRRPLPARKPLLGRASVGVLYRTSEGG
jgi:hypothetical protein